MTSGYASGIGGQLAYKSEVTYKTRVVPDRWYEFLSEDIQPIMSVVDVPGTRGDHRVQRTDRTKQVVKGLSGPLVLPVLNKNMGKILEDAFGQNTVTTITGSARRHTIIADALAQQGKFGTWQAGRPSIDGVINPFTFGGCKTVGAEFSCGVDQPLQVALDVDAANYTTGTSLATPSYVATQEPFIWSECVPTIAGTGIFAKSMRVKWTPSLAVDRIGLGNLKREPIANAMAMIEGELELEFDSLTEFANFIAGTTQELILPFTSATMITGSTPFAFTIKVNKAQWMAIPPGVKGAEILKYAGKFRGLYDGTNPPITVIADNADTVS